MKVELRIPSVFPTPKTDFEHARVWTAHTFLYVFPIDKLDIHSYRYVSGFHTGFSVWGGRCVWVNWDGLSTFPRSCPEMVLKALWFHFADK